MNIPPFESQNILEQYYAQKHIISGRGKREINNLYSMHPNVTEQEILAILDNHYPRLKKESSYRRYLIQEFKDNNYYQQTYAEFMQEVLVGDNPNASFDSVIKQYRLTISPQERKQRLRRVSNETNKWEISANQIKHLSYNLKPMPSQGKAFTDFMETFDLTLSQEYLKMSESQKVKFIGTIRLLFSYDIRGSITNYRYRNQIISNVSASIVCNIPVDFIIFTCYARNSKVMLPEQIDQYISKVTQGDRIRSNKPKIRNQLPFLYLLANELSKLGVPYRINIILADNSILREDLNGGMDIGLDLQMTKGLLQRAQLEVYKDMKEFLDFVFDDKGIRLLLGSELEAKIDKDFEKVFRQKENNILDNLMGISYYELLYLALRKYYFNRGHFTNYDQLAQNYLKSGGFAEKSFSKKDLLREIECIDGRKYLDILLRQICLYGLEGVALERMFPLGLLIQNELMPDQKNCYYNMYRNSFLPEINPYGDMC